MWWANPAQVLIEHEMRLRDAEIARRNRMLQQQLNPRKPILKRILRRKHSQI